MEIKSYLAGMVFAIAAGVLLDFGMYGVALYCTYPAMVFGILATKK